MPRLGVCASCLFNISPEQLTKGECKSHISILVVALLRAVPIISAITRRAEEGQILRGRNYEIT